MACRGAVTRPDQSSVRCPGSALVSSLQPVRVWRNPGVQTGRRRPRNGLAIAFAARSLHPAGERANGLLIIVRMLPTIALGTLEDKSAGPSQATPISLGWGSPSQIQSQTKKRPKLAARPLNWKRSLGTVFLHFSAKSVLN